MSTVELVPLVRIDQQNIADLFVAYLKSIDIDAAIEREDDAYIIYCQRDRVENARHAFTEFSQQPYNPKYQQMAWEQSDLSNQVTSSSPVSDLLKRFFEHAGIVTLSVFVLCWIIFLGSQLGFARDIFNAVKFYSVLNLETLFTQPQRLIGPAFFHFSWLHIVFNTMWWWQLGGAIEKVAGRMLLINLLLISAIASNLGQFLVSGDNFGGLSGVVYSVVGFVWWSGWLMPDKGLSLPKSVIGFLLVWLLLGFVDILPVNMANTAHLLGLVTGCLSAYWLSVKQKSH